MAPANSPAASVQDLTIGPLPPEEAPAVAEVMNLYAAQEVLLWRTADDVRQRCADFLVARRAGRVIGCVALRDYGDGLQELRSLAVHPDCAERGVGSSLIRAAIALARQRGTTLLFALTRRQHLFERLGFVRVERRVFPEKVWADCAVCPRQDHCNEVAVCLDVSDES